MQAELIQSVLNLFGIRGVLRAGSKRLFGISLHNTGESGHPFVSCFSRGLFLSAFGVQRDFEAPNEVFHRFRKLRRAVSGY